MVFKESSSLRGPGQEYVLTVNKALCSAPEREGGGALKSLIYSTVPDKVVLYYSW